MTTTAQSPPSPKDWLVVILTHLGLTGLMTWPALIQLNSGVFGGARGDKWVYIWDFWWFKQALLTLHQSPLATAMQYHPTGTSLALHDLNILWALLSIPLQSFLALPTILNLFMLSCFILNGLAFYRLAFELTGSRCGALAGSVLFAYCPFFLGRFSVSHIGFLSAFFIPLFLLSLWRYRQHKRQGDLLWAALYLALATLCHLYYGVILLLLAAAYLLYLILCLPTRGHRLQLGKHTLAAIFLFGAILAPLVVPIVGQLARGDFDNPAQEAEGKAALEGNSADLFGYLIPDFTIASWRGYDLSPAAGRIGQSFQKATSGNFYEKTVYPGWTSWLLLIATLLLPALRKQAWPWLLLALFFFVWTLGPTLFIKGRPYLQGLLPLHFLPSLPVLRFLRTPTRFALFVTLGSGMVAASAAMLLARNRPRTAQLFSLGVTVLALTEFIPFPQTLIPSEFYRSPFYERLRHDPNPGAVLDIPVDFYGARGGGDLYEYAQTIHQKPIVGGYIARTPRAVDATLQNSPFLKAVEHHEYDQDPRLTLTAEGFADLVPSLTRMQIRYLIVHRNLIPPNQWSSVLLWLERGVGLPLYEDQWIRVYPAPNSATL